MATEDKVERCVLAQGVGCLVGGAMDEEDGGVATSGAFQFGGYSVGNIIVKVDGITLDAEV